MNASESPVSDVRPDRPHRSGVLAPLLRTPVKNMTARRLVRGGRPDDGGRIPRYAGALILGLALIWAPIVGYLRHAPERFTSSMSLILPGSGSSASVNLSEIGQASSYASSPFASSAVSPTVTYKRLIGADRIVDAAARSHGVARHDFGAPRVELVDQTGLINVQVTGGSAEDAQARGEALLAAFFEEIDALRADELAARATGGRGAIDDYRADVASTRAEIAALQAETGLHSAAQYQTLVSDSDLLAREVAAMRIRLSEKQSAVVALERSLGVSPDIAAATLKLHADSEFSALATEMAQQATRLAEARSRYGASHPEVLDAQRAHDGARATALARAARITGLPQAGLAQLDLAPVGGRGALLAQLVELDAEARAAEAELAATTARLDRDRARVEALRAPAARLEDLQRNFRVAEAVFASAMARSETTKGDPYASYPLVQVLENPSLPGGPSSPRKTLAIAAGGAGSMMLAIGLLLGWMRRPLIDRLVPPRAATDAV